MGGLGSMGTWQDNELAQRDHIHFTRKGYQMLADLMSNALFETLVQLKPKHFAPTDEVKPKPQDDKHLYKKRTSRNADGKDANKKDNEGPDYISY